MKSWYHELEMRMIFDISVTLLSDNCQSLGQYIIRKKNDENQNVQWQRPSYVLQQRTLKYWTNCLIDETQ